MKVIIPLAGKGTRLRPHTLTTPKPLLHVAGKPILGHMLDAVVELGLKDVVFVVGPMRDQIEAYVAKNYRISATYVEQGEPKGLGHAVYVTKNTVGDGPVLIIYGDTLFEGDLRPYLSLKGDGALATVLYDDPRPYGIAELSGNKVTLLIEKPPEKKPGEVLIGVNIFRSSAMLYAAIEELMRRDIRTKGEYQLTDAMQLLVEQGKDISVFPVRKWLDCGNRETMLSTNAYLLKSKGKVSCKGKNCRINGPCHIPASALLENCTLGPNVSLGENVTIRDSTVSDSIIHSDCLIEDAHLKGSLIGNHTKVRKFSGTINLGDYSEIDGSA